MIKIYCLTSEKIEKESTLVNFQLVTLKSGIFCHRNSSGKGLSLVVIVTNALPFFVYIKHAPQPSLYTIQHTSLLNV